MMSLSDWALKHKIYYSTQFKIVMLQVPIRKVPAISTVWSVITTALIPTKWWHIEDNIRSWTVFLPQGLKSLPPPNIVPPLAVVTMENRHIITAENVNMLFWVCHRWKLTSTGIWMNRELRELRDSGVTRCSAAWKSGVWHTVSPHSTNIDITWCGKLGLNSHNLMRSKFNLKSISSLIIWTQQTQCQQSVQSILSTATNPSLMWSDDPKIFVLARPL